MTILTDFLNYLGVKALIWAVLFVLVFVVTMLDLRSGIKKAKKRKEYISSYGLRQTISKLERYFILMLAFTVVDIIQMLAIFELRTQGVALAIPILPILTFFVAVFICFIEIKSIFEKSEEKEKAKVADTAKVIDAAIKILKKDNTLDEMLTKLNPEKNEGV